MKITCNHFNSKNATFLCETCKHYQTCSLIEPTNKNHTLLLTEIQYWLKELQQAKQRIKDYEDVLKDIQNHKYCYAVNVYGHICYAPKQNSFGVFIQRPEHVVYGWNYDKLVGSKDELMEKIRLLNRKELNMRRILERRAGEVYD